MIVVAQMVDFAWPGVVTMAFAPFATTVLGWTALDTRLLFSIYGLVSVVFGPPFACLADHLGQACIAQLSCLPLAACLLALVLGLPLPVLYALTLVSDGATTSFVAGVMAVPADVTDPAVRGHAFGTVSGLGQVGNAAGALVAAARWQSADIATALLTANVALLVSVGTLALLPSRARPAATPAPPPA